MRERGGDVRTSRPVRIVKRSAGGFDVTFAGGTEAFDLVLSTVAIPELLRLAPDLPEETRKAWSAISYCHALCPILELDRSLSPYYWLNVGDDAMPFGGVIEHTNFLSPGGLRRPAHRVPLELRPAGRPEVEEARRGAVGRIPARR